MRPLIALLLIFILAACQLTSAPETEEIVVGVTVNATTVSQPTARTIQATVEPLATQTPIQVGNCTIPSGWQAYTVASGDTLFAIAREFDSSVDELVDSNCLESANLLEVGQTLYVPGDETASGQNNVSSNRSSSDMIVYWLGSDNPINSSSIEVGCETYLTPYETGTPRSDNPEDDIRTALTMLFNLQDEGLRSERNYWNEYGLTVGDVSISNGRAEVEILGEGFLLGGTCSDPEIIDQMLFVVFADPSVQTAFITVDGENLAQFSDMSGLSGADATFSRDRLPDGF